MNIYSKSEAKQMPGFDGTGPRGFGPVTGRGLGPCGRGMAYGRAYPFGYGCGFGRGRGFGRGYRMGYGLTYSAPAPLNTNTQKQFIEAEIRRIDAEKAELQQMLATLGSCQEEGGAAEE